MGSPEKSIDVAMTQTDEETFLAFLHQTGDIVLLESFARTIEGLWSMSFSKEAKRFSEHWFYDIWNKAFAPEPKYERTQNTGSAERDGWYYVSNSTHTPLIEFMRSGDIRLGQTGFLTWKKNFYAGIGVKYDVEKFSKWYEKIVRWIKKNSAGKITRGGMTIYYLPDAWSIYSERQQSEERKIK